jgi:hypothetical protein
MSAIKTKPFALYAPISRRDDAERIVEGVCFENEIVNGEGGLRLCRSAMQEATADYLRWGALREMHQPIAAGTATAINWVEENGKMVGKIMARVVDDQAWRKVTEGVYKGFSVTVRPLIMRGRDITKVEWVETSLVDRPKDQGARITLFRGEGMTAEEVSEESTAWDAGLEPASPALLARELRRISGAPAELQLPAYEAAVAGFAGELLSRLDDGNVSDVLAVLAAADPETLSRLEGRTAEAEAKLIRAEAEIERLRREPAQTMPIRFPEAFIKRREEENAGRESAVATLRKEYEELRRAEPAKTDNEQLERSMRVGELRDQLRALGFSVD